MRPRALLRKQGIFVLDALKGHLTLDIRSVTQAMNSELVIIPGSNDFITTQSNEQDL